VGFVFKSQGLIADAINSFGDVFSSLVTFVGGKISSKPADDDHEFGHGKAEFVASLLIGIFMIFVSIKTMNSGFKSIINNEGLTFSLIVGAIYLLIFIYNIIPGLPFGGNLLDYSQTLYIDKLFGYNSFFNSGFVFVVTFLFFLLDFIL
jgi:cation diffusion facilitator family transporter